MCVCVCVCAWYSYICYLCQAIVPSIWSLSLFHSPLCLSFSNIADFSFYLPHRRICEPIQEGAPTRAKRGGLTGRRGWECPGTGMRSLARTLESLSFNCIIPVRYTYLVYFMTFITSTSPSLSLSLSHLASSHAHTMQMNALTVQLGDEFKSVCESLTKHDRSRLRVIVIAGDAEFRYFDLKESHTSAK